MPNETQEAVKWALEQCFTEEGHTFCVKGDNGEVNKHMLVDYVRKYFNDKEIDYSTFSYSDLKPYLD